MPIENRSSNTEVAGRPREHELKIHTVPLNELLSEAKTGEIRDCYDRDFAVGDTVLLREVAEDRSYTGRTAHRTITHVQKHYGLPDHLCVLSYGKPAEQHQGEPSEYPPCDYCGIVPDHHPWHGSGLLSGVENRHIHACDACRGRLPLHPGQHKGEPVMRLECEKLLDGDGEYAVDFVKPGWLKECREKGGTFLLYTHADADAGEAERPSQIALSLQAKLKSVESERDRLRAKLAEQEHSARELLRIIGMSVQGSAAYNRAVIAFHDSLNADTKPN